MQHPSMTTRGKRIAALFAVALVFLLPKRVECGYPGGQCKRVEKYGQVCVEKELEPFGFYLIELLAKTDVGFAYSTTDDCR